MAEILQTLVTGLDKGGAYALIALGLTIIFGTLGVVNFAHGALFMLGSFCAVFIKHRVFTASYEVVSETKKDFMGQPLKEEIPYVVHWFGDFGNTLIDYAVPLSIVLAIPVMLAIGIAMERGLIRFFYKRPHADQILVTFGLAIVLQELIKAEFGANQIPTDAPSAFGSPVDIGIYLGFEANQIIYRSWQLVYTFFSIGVIMAVFAFLQFTTFGMVVRAGMADRETVGLLGIDIDRRFTTVFGIAAVVTGLAGVMYAPNEPPNYDIGMNFLVLSFVVVVVGGMGSLGGAVAAGFLLGILQSFAAMPAVKDILPGIDQIIVYLVAVVILLLRPRGLMGRKGVMET